MAAKPDGVARHGWLGRSDIAILRKYFEVNAESIAVAVLSRMAREGEFDTEKPSSVR